MDGLKRRLNESVQLKLSFTLSLAILVVAVGTYLSHRVVERTQQRFAPASRESQPS